MFVVVFGNTQVGSLKPSLAFVKLSSASHRIKLPSPFVRSVIADPNLGPLPRRKRQATRQLILVSCFPGDWRTCFCYGYEWRQCFMDWPHCRCLPSSSD